MKWSRGKKERKSKKNQMSARFKISPKNRILLGDNRFFKPPPGKREHECRKYHETEIRDKDNRWGVLVVFPHSNEIRANGKIPDPGDQQRHGIIHCEYF